MQYHFWKDVPGRCCKILRQLGALAIYWAGRLLASRGARASCGSGTMERCRAMRPMGS